MLIGIFVTLSKSPVLAAGLAQTLGMTFNLAEWCQLYPNIAAQAEQGREM
jgi:hypothetical protein